MGGMLQLGFTAESKRSLTRLPVIWVRFALVRATNEQDFSAPRT